MAEGAIDHDLQVTGEAAKHLRLSPQCFAGIPDRPPAEPLRCDVATGRYEGVAAG